MIFEKMILFYMGNGGKDRVFSKEYFVELI